MSSLASTEQLDPALTTGVSCEDRVGFRSGVSVRSNEAGVLLGVAGGPIVETRGDLGDSGVACVRKTFRFLAMVVFMVLVFL